MSVTKQIRANLALTVILHHAPTLGVHVMFDLLLACRLRLEAFGVGDRIAARIEQPDKGENHHHFLPPSMGGGGLRLRPALADAVAKRA